MERLTVHHDVFSLEEEEQGEISLVEFTINTRNSAPKKHAACRIPYTARQEIANLFSRMQNEGSHTVFRESMG